LKVLHAKIGELTLENDFLAGALSKAGCWAQSDDRPWPRAFFGAAGRATGAEPEHAIL
jgi:hypothetical protein